MSTTEAPGDVIIRHTCDGRLCAPERTERRVVYLRKHGGYFIRLWTREWPVTRVEGTSTFICEFAGRT